MSVARPSGTTNYTYDNCGRPTQIGSRTLTWDYDERLTTLSGSGIPFTSYGYNGIGTRISKSNSNGTRSNKRDGIDVSDAVLGDGNSVIVPGVSEKSGGQTNFIHTDRLGSMKGISNSAFITETAEYDAFGKVVAHSNPSSTQQGFAAGVGYQEDGESGYKLLGHRYYDPEIGRFLTRDLAQEGRNWYGYCDNNPLAMVDPTGLSGEEPPVPLPRGGPGNGWKFNPDGRDKRGGKWGPKFPIKDGDHRQPSASRDPGSRGGPPHWDVDDGKGSRQRFSDKGKPMGLDDVHPNDAAKNGGKNNKSGGKGGGSAIAEVAVMKICLCLSFLLAPINATGDEFNNGDMVCSDGYPCTVHKNCKRKRPSKKKAKEPNGAEKKPGTKKASR